MVINDEWVLQIRMFVDILLYWNNKEIGSNHLLISKVSKIFAVLDSSFWIEKIFCKVFWLFTIICTTNIVFIIFLNLNNKIIYEALICSACQFQWCKISHHDWFQAINGTLLNTGLGKDEPFVHHSIVFPPYRSIDIIPTRVKIIVKCSKIIRGWWSLSTYCLCFSSQLYLTMDFLGGSAGKDSTYNAGDLDSIPGLGGHLEKGRVTHSRILAWRIPRTEEPVVSKSLTRLSS